MARKSNRSGSVFFSESENRWRAEIHWVDKNGKSNFKKFSGKKKQVVVNKLEEFKRSLLISEGDLSSEAVTLREFAGDCISNKLVHGLKPSSYQRILVTLSNQVYPFLGDIPIDKIEHRDVQNMINKLNDSGLSYSTIKKAYGAVNTIMREYRIRTKKYINPCEGIVLPVAKKKETSDIHFLSSEQKKAVVQEATRVYSTGKSVYRLGYCIPLLMYTGMRIGELIALEWSDVNFEEKIITINKNAVDVKAGETYTLLKQNTTKTYSGSRLIPMTQTAYDSLIELRKVTGEYKHVLSSKNDKMILPSNINRMFHSVLIGAGIAKDKKDKEHLCGVHILRHTFASMLFENGCDVKVVSEILGHSDTKITENIYIHLLQKQKVKAIQDIDKYSN